MLLSFTALKNIFSELFIHKYENILFDGQHRSMDGIGKSKNEMKGCKEDTFFPRHLSVSAQSQPTLALAIYFAGGRTAEPYPFLFEVAKL